MGGPRDWRVLLGAMVMAACTLVLCRVPQAWAQTTPEKPEVYNHIIGNGTEMDQVAHQTYDAEFKVVDFRDYDGAYSPPEEKYAPRPKTAVDKYGTPITGKVVAFFIITAQGQVVKPVIVASTDPRLNPVVLETLAQWTFEPARVAGREVAVVGGQEFDAGATP